MTGKLEWKDYPEAVTFRSGCKVSWRYYENEHAALEAALAAKNNARILRAKGYDFGYQSPGAVRRMPESWGKFSGLWEVTLP